MRLGSVMLINKIHIIRPVGCFILLESGGS
jgi:hypothetical protein